MQENLKSLKGLALLVVDVQEKLLPAIKEHKELTNRILFSIKAAELLGIEVIFTEQSPEKLGNTHAQLTQGLNGPACTFTKTAFSALKAPGLLDYLRENNFQHLLIAGIETPICIYQTVLCANNYNISTTLLSDAIGARRSEDAQVAIDSLKKNNSLLLPSETVFYSIIEDASHSCFSAFCQIVKQHA